MIIVASANGDVGIGAGIDILRAGGSALDAVEAACRLVEDNPDDHSVGTGSYPNLVGEVELDASIMEGSARRAGAVAALKDYPYPVSVARAVMEHLPQHLLLVGEGAARFAAEQGFTRRRLLTEYAEESFRRRSVVLHGEAYSFDGGVLSRNGSVFARNGSALPRDETAGLGGAANGHSGNKGPNAHSGNGHNGHGPGRNGHSATPARQTGTPAPAEQVARMADAAKTYGTVNFLAVDGQGRIASAVSTSGWAFKYPGRVGDSPLIGAGNYCDDRFGACACTGLGEWAIRASTARSVVMAMQFGMDLEDACAFALRDLLSAPPPRPVEPVMNLVALDRSERHAAYTTIAGRTYIWQRPDMTAFETALRAVFPPFFG